MLQYALDIAWSRHCYKVMLMTGSKHDVTMTGRSSTGMISRRSKTGQIIVILSVCLLGLSLLTYRKKQPL